MPAVITGQFLRRFERVSLRSVAAFVNSDNGDAQHAANQSRDNETNRRDETRTLEPYSPEIEDGGTYGLQAAE